MKKLTVIKKEVLSLNFIASKRRWTTKIVALLIALIGIVAQSNAQITSSTMPHEMQHGFVLAEDDKFASHLVATGHHSRQAEITGQLLIDDQKEMEFYQERKLQSAGSSYFLFQAQNLNLPTLSAGQVLTGHIVESKIGDYEPKNKIVRSATFQVQKVLLNISNPFFSGEEQHSLSSQSKRPLRQDDSYSNDLLNSIMSEKSEKENCCIRGVKPCNLKCY